MLEVIIVAWSVGGLGPIPPTVTRLNLTFLDENLEFRVLSVRCRDMSAVCSWLDTLVTLAGYTLEGLGGNWELLKGKIYHLRLRDGKVVGILSPDKKNVLKIRSEIRYDA